MPRKTEQEKLEEEIEHQENMLDALSKRRRYLELTLALYGLAPNITIELDIIGESILKCETLRKSLLERLHSLTDTGVSP
jgi:hypothetical protein